MTPRQTSVRTGNGIVAGASARPTSYRLLLRSQSLRGPGRQDGNLVVALGRAPEASRAGVAQLAERLLPKQKVAGSNPVSRSSFVSSTYKATA